MSFLNYLSEKGVIESGAITSILNEIKKKGKDLDSLLAEAKVDDNEIAKLKGEYYKIPVKSLAGKNVSYEILKNVPEESARHYGFVPIAISNGVLEVGILDPQNMQAKDALQFISTNSGLPFKLYIISKSDFEETLKSYEGLSGEVTKALSEIGVESGDEEVELIQDKKESDKDKKISEASIKEDAPVTKIVAVILRHATEGGASDVHIEHMGDKVRVRFRVDGVLYTSILLPPDVHNAVVARIKILAKLKLDEKRKPQDNRFSARIDGRKIDFRVSTFPAYYGEKVVMRILDPEKGMHDLKSLGLSSENINIVEESIKRPYGMILITGPTGSGKTSTLYAMLQNIDKEKINVVSLEDPVEYHIDGMSQSQVRPEIGYTFANGLRSILRQDPDVIMVGEIRDKETAELAIQAALTGHLVFSTLHTNNAIGVVPRLVDMGIDPYLIAPTLILTIGQRLVRTLCVNSKKQVDIEESTKILIRKNFEDAPDEMKVYVEKKIEEGYLYEPQPSPECPGGIKGRIAVFELLRTTDIVKTAILEKPTENEIWKAARGQGMITMREDAIIKALDGTIPFEEVYNV